MSPDHIKDNPNASTQPSPSELTKSIYVKRSNGEISTMRITENSTANESGRHLAYIVEQDDDDGSEFIAGFKPIPENVLGVDMQAALGAEYSNLHPEQAEKITENFKVIEELGKEALEASEVELDSESVAATNEVTGVELSASAERKLKNPHLAKLFEPQVRPNLPPSKINLMDAMFSKEDDVFESAQAAKLSEERANAPILKEQRDYDRITNQDTREYSEQQLIAAMRRDGTLREILAEKGFAEASIDAVDKIREDADLRYAVGEHLLTKLSRMIDDDKANRGNNFGPRLIANGEKRNNYIALSEMTSSREYAAYLALAKISGMFNYKDDSSDIFQDQDGSGTILLNQHRHAADMLL